MGILTGKLTPEAEVPDDDLRREWDLRGGRERRLLEAAERLRPLLTTGGRTPAQGALGWVWARSAPAIPIPGFRTETQVRENAEALAYGPLPDEVLAEVEALVPPAEAVV